MSDPKTGWSAADVDESELASQSWLDANVKPGKPYNPARHQAAVLKNRTLRTAQKLGLSRKGH